MAATIVEAARRLGVTLAVPDGSAKVSGHSLRATGAQGLARAGLEVWAIQLLGRWGSATVLDYIREVPLELSSSWASRVAREGTLEDQLRVSSRRLPPRTSLGGATSCSPPTSRASCISSSARSSLDDAFRAELTAVQVATLPPSDCSVMRSSSGR